MDPALLIAVRLSREGYGPALEIKSSPTRVVLAMLTHSNFLSDLQETAAELNREDPS